MSFKTICKVIILVVLVGIGLFWGHPATAAADGNCQGKNAGNPFAGDDKAVIFKPNTIVSIDPLRLAHDPDGCSLTLVSLGKPKFGIAHIEPYQDILYEHSGRLTPAIDQFSYTIKNSKGQIATATITVLLYQPDLPPPVGADLTVNIIVGRWTAIKVVDSSVDQLGYETGQPMIVTGVEGFDQRMGGYGIGVYELDTLYYGSYKAGVTSFYYDLYSNATGLTGRGKITVYSREALPPIAPDYTATTKPGQKVEVNVLSKALDPDAIYAPGRQSEKYIWLLGLDMKLTAPPPGKLTYSDHSIFFTPDWNARGTVVVYYRIQSNFFSFLSPISTGKVTFIIQP